MSFSLAFHCVIRVMPIPFVTTLKINDCYFYHCFYWAFPSLWFYPHFKYDLYDTYFIVKTRPNGGQFKIGKL